MFLKQIIIIALIKAIEIDYLSMGFTGLTMLPNQFNRIISNAQVAVK
jgi:hypothetical protein